MPRRFLQWQHLLLLIYGLLNSILYAGLLPLWDGFDEPFHYSYVQELSQARRLPVIGRSALSREVSDSLVLAPASHLVKRNIPDVITFDQYFKLSHEERARLRSDLLSLQTGHWSETGTGLNYEAHQAPLAYVILALPDLALSEIPLPNRVLVLRIIGASLATVFVGWLILWLCVLLAVPVEMAFCAVFVTFSSQVFYATVAHICNDWLTVILFVAIVILGAACYRKPSHAALAAFGVALSLGLLCKASFLAVLPFGLGVICALALERRLTPSKVGLFAVGLAVSAPWYVRNLLLYRNLSGMQESAHGTPFLKMAESVFHFPWPRAVWTTASSCIWFGNNSATTFSSRTVGLAAGLLALSVIVAVIGTFRGRRTPIERLAMGACLSYAIGLLYSTLLSYWYTKGQGFAPAPWYVEPLEPVLLALLFGGLAKAGGIGRALVAAILWLWLYIMSATYVLKLIPFYGGQLMAHARISDLFRYYTQRDALYDFLDTTSLLPSWALIGFTVVVILLGISLAITLSLSLKSRVRRQAM